MATGTGRNDNCPCGSGMKYKKCCLARDEERAKAGYPTPPENPSPEDMPAYSLLRLLEHPTPEQERLLMSTPLLRDVLAERTTIAQAAALSDTELLDRLRPFCIETDTERFRAAAQDTDSAWEIGQRWARGVHRELTVIETDFLGLAACELWKRWCPEPPSVEMLDDWVWDGYVEREQGHDGPAVDLWLRAWDHLRGRFTPEMRQCGAAERVFNGTQALFYWTQDLSDALLDAARDDRRYAAVAVRYTREILSQFTLEGMTYLQVFRTDLAEAHFLSGQPQEGEAVCRALLAEFPFSACGYVTLAEALVYPADGPRDYGRAIALLQQALDMPVRDAEDWDVAPRLQRLREERERAGAAR
jgi:hypothetical protein